MRAFYKRTRTSSVVPSGQKKQKEEFAQDLFMKGKEIRARAQGRPSLARSRMGPVGAKPGTARTGHFYPVYADFEPLVKDVKSYEQQPMRLVPLKEDGTPDIDALNAEFGGDYIKVKGNPRWSPNRPWRLCGRGR